MYLQGMWCPQHDGPLQYSDVCVYMCIYIYIYVCVCVCVCVYTHTKRSYEMEPTRKKIMR
jgi:hypothetical protein